MAIASAPQRPRTEGATSGESDNARADQQFSQPWADQLAQRAGIDSDAFVLCLEKSTGVSTRARVVRDCRCSLRRGGVIAVVSSSIPVVELVDLLISAGFAEVRVSSHRFRPQSPGRAAVDEINAVLAHAIRPINDPS